MWIGILGPLSVWPADDEIGIAAAKQRVVLAALLVHANHVVSYDELAAAVWDCAPPASSRVTLRNYVKSLRQSLGPAAERLVTRDPGYLIRLGPDELDLLRFRALCEDGGAAVRRGYTERAASVLAEALELWRGDPLADIPSDRLREGAVPGLERLRWQATEWRIDADLQLGRHADLLLELQGLVAEHPLRERFHAQLMLALYRGGRVAEALAAYEQARRALADQLGADPGPELYRLHERMLRGDAELSGADAGAHVPRQLPAAPPHFVGRGRELTALHAGGDGISTIEGTAGIGKTALALRFAHDVAPRFPDGQLYLNLRGFDPVSAPVEPVDVIRDFLAALGIDPQRIPADLAAQAALYRSAIAGRRMLILLDNARDAAQVRPLLPGGPGCLVLVTSRCRLTGLVVNEGARPLTLDLLTMPEARELVARRLGPVPSDELITLCARLPLALSIATARAASSAATSLDVVIEELRDVAGRLDGLETGDAASSVRAVLSWSYRQLSDAAAHMFRVLGLHPGPGIRVATAASAAAVPVARARGLLRELDDAHLITEDAHGRYSFHDLLRAFAAEQAAASESAPQRQAASQRMRDYYLHTAHAAALVVSPTRRPLDLPPIQSGAVPETPVGLEEALAWFETEHRAALALSEGGSYVWQIAWSLSRFFGRRGYWHQWETTERAALEAARRCHDDEGEASTHYRLGYALSRLGDHGLSQDHLRRALAMYERLGDQVQQARMVHSLAMGAEFQGHHRQALELAERALALVRTTDDRGYQALVLNCVGWCHAQLGDYQRAVHYCRRSLDLHREHGNVGDAADTLDSLGYALHHLRRYREAADCYSRALATYRRLADRWGQAECLAHLGDTRLAQGDPDAAGSSWREALAIYEGLRHAKADEIRGKLVTLSNPPAVAAVLRVTGR
jgi:DNA-binding SARP family transcriptional activator/Tfp pilus assembly protein PilF